MSVSPIAKTWLVKIVVNVDALKFKCIHIELMGDLNKLSPYGYAKENKLGSGAFGINGYEDILS